MLDIAAGSVGLTLSHATGVATFVFLGLASLPVIDLLAGEASDAVTVAFVVAWYSENVFVTIFVGMATLPFVL